MNIFRWFQRLGLATMLAVGSPAVASEIGRVKVCARAVPNLPAGAQVVVPGDLVFEAYGHLKGDLRDLKSELGDYDNVPSAHSMLATLGKFTLSMRNPCALLPARLYSLGHYAADETIRPDENILFIAQRLYWISAPDALTKVLDAEIIVAEVVQSVGNPFNDHDVDEREKLRQLK